MVGLKKTQWVFKWERKICYKIAFNTANMVLYSFSFLSRIYAKVIISEIIIISKHVSKSWCVWSKTCFQIILLRSSTPVSLLKILELIPCWFLALILENISLFVNKFSTTPKNLIFPKNWDISEKKLNFLENQSTMEKKKDSEV